MEPPERVHLLVDLENVKPTARELAQVRGNHIRLWILHGPQQKCFPAEWVDAWRPLGTQLELVQSTRAGPNALDLHVAFTIGRASREDQLAGVRGRYVVVSKDKDFDALIGHAGTRSVDVVRAESLGDALRIASDPAPEPRLSPQAKPAAKKAARSLSAESQTVVNQLREHPRNRPRTRQKLENHIRSVLGNDVNPDAVGKVVAELVSFSALQFEGNKVQYKQLAAAAT